MKQEHLHVMICHVEKESNNTETYYDFIRRSELEFEMMEADLSIMCDVELSNYIDFLDELWYK